jgi:hypothetical protein
VSSSDDLRWQRRLMPYMLVALGLAGAFFSVTTYLFFDRLQAELSYSRVDPRALIDRADPAAAAPRDAAYRDWLVRATLEQTLQQQRFNVQLAIVKGRLWSRFMGFLTGMLLALTGCVFVLGKLRADVDFSGEGGGAKAALTTTSPGLFLAFLGSVIIGMSLLVSGTIETSDTAIYLPPSRATAPAALPDAPLPLPAAPAGSTPPYPSPFSSPFAPPAPAPAKAPG